MGSRGSGTREEEPLQATTMHPRPPGVPLPTRLSASLAYPQRTRRLPPAKITEYGQDQRKRGLTLQVQQCRSAHPTTALSRLRPSNSASPSPYALDVAPTPAPGPAPGPLHPAAPFASTGDAFFPFSLDTSRCSPFFGPSPGDPSCGLGLGVVALAAPSDGPPLGAGTTSLGGRRSGAGYPREPAARVSRVRSSSTSNVVASASSPAGRSMGCWRKSRTERCCSSSSQERRWR